MSVLKIEIMLKKRILKDNLGKELKVGNKILVSLTNPETNETYNNYVGTLVWHKYAYCIEVTDGNQKSMIPLNQLENETLHKILD